MRKADTRFPSLLIQLRNGCNGTSVCWNLAGTLRTYEENYTVLVPCTVPRGLGLGQLTCASPSQIDTLDFSVCRKGYGTPIRRPKWMNRSFSTRQCARFERIERSNVNSRDAVRPGHHVRERSPIG